MRCIDVLRRPGRAGETLAADELGILGLFVDSARPDEREALARQVQELCDLDLRIPRSAAGDRRAARGAVGGRRRAGALT